MKERETHISLIHWEQQDATLGQSSWLVDLCCFLHCNQGELCASLEYRLMSNGSFYQGS